MRVGLISDECKGRIAFDFVRETWICIEDDGSSYPIGMKPAPEVVEFFDDGRGGES